MERPLAGVFRVSFLRQGGPLRGPLAVGARSDDGDRRPKSSAPPKAAFGVRAGQSRKGAGRHRRRRHDQRPPEGAAEGVGPAVEPGYQVTSRCNNRHGPRTSAEVFAARLYRKLQSLNSWYERGGGWLDRGGHGARLPHLWTAQCLGGIDQPTGLPTQRGGGRAAHRGTDEPVDTRGWGRG